MREEVGTPVEYHALLKCAMDTSLNLSVFDIYLYLKYSNKSVVAKPSTVQKMFEIIIY